MRFNGSRATKIGLIAIIAVLGVLYFAYSRVTLNANERTFDVADQVPKLRYGMVLGTSPRTPAGNPNPSFDNRMTAAALLYQAGRVNRLIVSGADYRKTQAIGFDEPSEMKKALIALGVPTDSIITDYDGQRTLKSVVNAKTKYGLDKVVFVSQPSHNERAIYIADHIGLKSVGFNAANPPYGWPRAKNSLREVGARVKMFMDLTDKSLPKAPKQ